MATITAAGLVNLNDSSTPFNKNGSVVTLKKISETDWLLFGDLAEGDSEGFPTGAVDVPDWSWKTSDQLGTGTTFFSGDPVTVPLSAGLDVFRALEVLPNPPSRLAVYPESPDEVFVISLVDEFGEYRGLNYTIEFEDGSTTSGVLDSFTTVWRDWDEVGGVSKLTIDLQPSSPVVYGTLNVLFELQA